LVVFEEAGPTREAVDAVIEWPDGPVRFVDTAGMRRATKLRGIEYFSVVRATQAIERAHVAMLVIDEDAHIVLVAADEVELTPTEFRLLSVLARNRGQVLSKRQLLEEVWGYDAYDENLVEVHISSLRKKLEGHAPRVLHTVRGVGYVLRG